MSKKISLYSIFLLISFISCKTKMDYFKPDEYKKPFLSFGTGGGFTGMVTTYLLTSEGKLYKKSNDDYQFISKVDKTQVKQIYTNYAVLGLDKMEIKDPGNKYYFIEKIENGVSSKIVWGNTPLENKNIDIFYTNIMQLIKDANTLNK